MTRIIIESSNNQDVKKIRELADRLKIKYEIQEITGINRHAKNKSQNWAIINKGIDVSNYGDPSLWQKEVRKKRDLDFPT